MSGYLPAASISPCLSLPLSNFSALICLFFRSSRHSGQVAFRQTTGRYPAPESMLFHPGTDQLQGNIPKIRLFRKFAGSLPDCSSSGNYRLNRWKWGFAVTETNDVTVAGPALRSEESSVTIREE